MLIQELDKNDAQAEEARKKAKSQAKNVPVSKVSRQAPKAPRKNTKKANNAEAVEEITQTFESAMEIGKLDHLIACFVLYTYKFICMCLHSLYTCGVNMLLFFLRETCRESQTKRQSSSKESCA